MKISEKRVSNLGKRIPEKNKAGLCAVPYCSKVKGKKDPLCGRCRKQHDKVNLPERYAFRVLKNNARRRGKEFTISLEYFLKLCAETGYLEHRGRRPTSLTIDRIDSSRGYVEGNLRVVEMWLNSSKGNRDLPNENPLPF